MTTEAASPVYPDLPTPLLEEEGTQWIKNQGVTQIPRLEALPLASMIPAPFRSDPHLFSNKESSPRHHQPLSPAPPLPLKSQSSPSLANSSAPPVNNLLSSLQHLSEREHSIKDSQQALKKQNEMLRQRLSVLETQRVRHHAEREKWMSKALAAESRPAAQLAPDLLHLIPKPDILVDKLNMQILPDRPKDSTLLKTISGTLVSAASRGKTWFKANQATIIRVAVIILVIILAPTLLPVLGI